ncbi:MAG: ATP-dependent helicase, partial [Desulfofustis sp.]|nr:ATP-dependent helicase [Desulfofustis sp.]
NLFEDSDLTMPYTYLATLVDNLANQRNVSDRTPLPEGKGLHSLTVLFAALSQFWLNSSLEQDLEREIHTFCRRAEKHGYHLFSICLADLLAHVFQEPERYQERAAELSAQTGLQPFLAIIESEESWKRSLQALINISSASVQDTVNRDVRLVWLVEYRRGNISARPREQKRTDTGTWSKGRPVSLERLHGSSQVPFLTLQDRKMCLAIRKEENVDGQPHYDFDREKLLLALVGHPLLFLEASPSTPVEFVLGEPELLVQEQEGDLHIHFSIPISNDSTALLKETPTRFKVIRINDNHRRIAQITGRNGLTVPIEASEQVLTAIGNISSFMTVHSAIAADASAQQSRDITLVQADSNIYMHLLPYGKGFRLEMFVKPFAEGTHYLKPGQGVENIMAEVGGRRLQTRRNLGEEERKAREIEELCPILDLAIDLEQGNDREWHLHDPDDCLQALLELQEINDRVTIEWPEGEKLTVTHQASFANLNLKIRTNRQNWFGISGELVLDQEKVIDLKDLLNRVSKSSGRFVEVSPGQFLALTQEF